MCKFLHRATRLISLASISRFSSQPIAFISSPPSFLPCPNSSYFLALEPEQAIFSLDDDDVETSSPPVGSSVQKSPSSTSLSSGSASTPQTPKGNPPPAGLSASKNSVSWVMEFGQQKRINVSFEEISAMGGRSGSIFRYICVVGKHRFTGEASNKQAAKTRASDLAKEAIESGRAVF